VAGRKTVLLRDAFFGQVVRGDVLVFARPSSVYAASFDAVSLEVGEPRLVLESVATGGPGFPSADLSVTDNGTAAWVSAVRSGGSQLMAIDRDGQVESLPAASSELFMPRASPDGRFVTYSTLRDGDFEIWRLDLNRGTASPWLTEGSTLALVWSPDGARVAYSSLRDGVGRLYVRPVLGSEEVALHSFADGTVVIPTSWGSDGRILLLHIATGSSEDIYAIPASGGELVPIFESDDHEQAAVLSPRGRLLAWVSDRRILVKPLAGEATAPTVVTNHGRMPRWSRDGRSLFFLTGDRSSRMMVVDVDTPEDGDLPVLSAPRELFDHEFGGNGVGGGMHRYDVLSDGRFVFVTPPVERASVVNVQLGWLDEVEARLAER
jgi:hypothetical protein